MMRFIARANRLSSFIEFAVVCSAGCLAAACSNGGVGTQLSPLGGAFSTATGGSSAKGSSSSSAPSGGSDVGSSSESGGAESGKGGSATASSSSAKGGSTSSSAASAAIGGAIGASSSPAKGGASAKGGSTGAGGASASGGSSAKSGGGAVAASGGGTAAGMPGTSAAGAASGTGGKSSAGGASSVGGASSQVCAWDEGPSATDGTLTCYWFSQGTSKDEKTCPGGYKTYCGYCGSETGTKPQTGQIWCPINDIKSTVANISTEHFVAMPPGALGNGKNCGACVEVTYMGTSIVATVVDSCPSCVSEQALDLSLSAAKALGMTEEMGQVEAGNGVRWRIVGCPTTGNISVNFNGGYQGQVYFQNTAFPIATATSGGKAASANTGFWDFGKEMGGQEVTLTDVMGHTVTGTVPSSPGTLGKQFDLTCN
jgi:hypothetical protein